MSTSTAKRALLYRFDRPPAEAIVNPAAYLLPEGIELLTTNGMVQRVPYTDVKAVCFASEVGPANLFTLHNFFERRPKAPGLWARFTLRDGDRLDGILSHNLLEWPESGYMLTPPRSSGTRQRVFLPRAALTATELRGVVGVATAAPASAGTTVDEPGQMRMFDHT